MVLFLRHRNWSWRDHPEESLAAMSSAGAKAIQKFM
jgi:hypothetical protein